MKKIKDIRKKLVKGADFAQTAKEVSEDPGSKERGGELGAFSRGMMVPEFEKAAFSLAVGQLSDVVTTPFGYHLIKVDEKKAATKPAFEPVKDGLKEFLFQQRAAKRFEEFVKDVRSKATIKINDIR
jgi:parvulin-like peptidyl-prolyl isomerase